MDTDKPLNGYVAFWKGKRTEVYAKKKLYAGGNKMDTPTQLRYRIKHAVKDKDISFAHVLLHSLARVYNHTPYPVRMERLKPFAAEFPLLCTLCIKSCSQAGKRKGGGQR